VPAICEFLGLRYSADMLAIEQADRTKILADQASWFPTLFDGINTDAVARWQREMSPRDQAMFASLAREELEALGYAVPTRRVPPPSPKCADLYRRHNELMRNVNFIRLRVFQERGRELRFALQRRVRDPIRRDAA
jgi:hypothetical protein